jgi:hypothetical protein
MFGFFKNRNLKAFENEAEKRKRKNNNEIPDGPRPSVASRARGLRGACSSRGQRAA